MDLPPPQKHKQKPINQKENVHKNQMLINNLINWNFNTASSHLIRYKRILEFELVKEF